MPRRRRLFKSRALYEICFRARNSLPLSCCKIIETLIKSSIARTQRDDKVIICHDLWNGSHCHMLVVSQDSEQLKRFYEELQKRITDYMKRLLGINYLNIWEGYPMVAEIADLKAAKSRISYIYANPAQDNLESSIERFPGYSSWNDFNECRSRLSASTSIKVPWVRLPTIPKLKTLIVNDDQSRRINKLFSLRNRDIHILKREPNAWMRCFNIKNDSDVLAINDEIMKNVRIREQLASDKRNKKGWLVMGFKALKSQPIMKSHSPKKRSRKIFVISSIKKLRINIIQNFKKFCDICKDCYKQWRLGNFKIEWPLGAFKPPLPPMVNLLYSSFS